MTVLEVLEAVRVKLDSSSWGNAASANFHIEVIFCQMTDPNADLDAQSKLVRLKSDVVWALFMARLTFLRQEKPDTKTDDEDDILATLDLAIEQTKNPEDLEPIVCRIA